MVCSMERQASRELSPANDLGVGPRQALLDGAGLESRAVRGESSLLACQKSYCASNRCRYSFGVQCFSSRKVLMK